MFKIFSTCLLALCCFTVSAEKIEGLIITKTEDSLQVTFEIPLQLFTREPDYERLQRKVKYYDVNGKKQTLKPKDAKEIHFTYKNERIRMRARRNTSSFLGGTFSLNAGDYIFLRLLEDGPVQLFLYYYTQNSPGVVDPTTGIMTGGLMYDTDRCLLQKGDAGELTPIRALFFKKDMSAFFSDCPELVKKIEEKEFKREHLREIVQFYNTQCGK
jgi:hypothetical protein